MLLVDGYNVIRRPRPTESSPSDDLEAAREALVSDVAAYAQGEWDATVVFDGGGNPHSDGQPHEFAGVTVIFSRYGVDADTVIEALARAARERGEHVVVVTTDAQTQWAVLGGEVVRMSSAEFAGELQGATRASGASTLPRQRRDVRVEDRIDADVRGAVLAGGHAARTVKIVHWRSY